MPVFEFDRYVHGRLMAEGVIITKANTLEEAMQSARHMYRENLYGTTLKLRTTQTREGDEG